MKFYYYLLFAMIFINAYLFFFSAGLSVKDYLDKVPDYTMIVILSMSIILLFLGFGIVLSRTGKHGY